MLDQNRQLMTRIQAGDRDALRTLFEQEYTSVCGVIRRYTLDPGLMEDLAQEVFLRFWEKAAQIDVTSNLPAYLRRMAVNEALAYFRKKSRFQADELPAQMPGMITGSADAQLEADELSQAVTHAVDNLPERCRLIFQLSRYEEMSYREIAEQLDISIKTVENQMGKALRVLREELAPFLAERG